MQQNIERAVIERMKQCKLCGGVCYYNKEGSDKRSRCQTCIEDDIFLFRYRNAGLNEKFIDVKLAKDVREKFHRNFTVFVETLNPNMQEKYAHSAGYFAAKYLYHTQIFADVDIIDTVFNNAGVIERSAQLGKFVDPTFAVFFLGKTPNKNFIGAHIMHILRSRQSASKFTFIVIPNLASVTSTYKHDELDAFLVDLSTNKAQL